MPHRIDVTVKQAELHNFGGKTLYNEEFFLKEDGVGNSLTVDTTVDRAIADGYVFEHFGRAITMADLIASEGAIFLKGMTFPNVDVEICTQARRLMVDIHFRTMVKDRKYNDALTVTLWFYPDPDRSQWLTSTLVPKKGSARPGVELGIWSEDFINAVVNLMANLVIERMSDYNTIPSSHQSLDSLQTPGALNRLRASLTTLLSYGIVASIIRREHG